MHSQIEERADVFAIALHNARHRPYSSYLAMKVFMQAQVDGSIRFGLERHGIHARCQLHHRRVFVGGGEPGIQLRGLHFKSFADHVMAFHILPVGNAYARARTGPALQQALEFQAQTSFLTQAEGSCRVG